MLEYRDGELGLSQGQSFFGFNAVPTTPSYIYDLDGFRQRVKDFIQRVPAKVHFAMKANHHPEILKVLKGEGVGLDVVSGGEIQWALDLGFSPRDIIFSGVGKSRKEILMALELGIGQINVESLPELKRVRQMALESGTTANVALRINPDVNPETHPYIRTGFRENKFGIDPVDLDLLAGDLDQNGPVKLMGISMHIGSQIFDLETFREAIEKALDVYVRLRSKGFAMTTLDVGGGLGINYSERDESRDLELISQYGSLIREIIPPEIKVLCEPGRILVARFGVLLCQVEYVKRTAHKNFLIVNTGMHHLLRPALYEAFHDIVPVRQVPGHDVFEVVGPICESADVLGRERRLPNLNEGDRLVILDVGAYGSVLSSNYNLQEKAREICISGGRVLT